MEVWPLSVAIEEQACEFEVANVGGDAERGGAVGVGRGIDRGTLVEEEARDFEVAGVSRDEERGDAVRICGVDGGGIGAKEGAEGGEIVLLSGAVKREARGGRGRRSRSGGWECGGFGCGERSECREEDERDEEGAHDRGGGEKRVDRATSRIGRRRMEAI